MIKLSSILRNIHNCWLVSCCTARGSSTRFSLLSNTKVEAPKYFLFTEKFLCIENKEHFLFIYPLTQPQMANQQNISCERKTISGYQQTRDYSFQTACEMTSHRCHFPWQLSAKNYETKKGFQLNKKIWESVYMFWRLKYWPVIFIVV